MKTQTETESKVEKTAQRTFLLTATKSLSQVALSLTATLLSLHATAASEVQISAWSKQAYSPAIVNFPYKYKIGLELEILPRHQTLIVGHIDWKKISPFLDTANAKSQWWTYGDNGKDPRDMTLDYLNPTSVAELRSSPNPDVQKFIADLAAGLNLEAPQIEQKRVDLLGTDGTAVNSREKKTLVSSLSGVGPQQLLGLDGQPINSTSPQGTIIQQNGLLVPKHVKDSKPLFSDVIRNDWLMLNQRWNALPLEERIRYINIANLDAKKQVRLLPYVLSQILTRGLPESDDFRGIRGQILGEKLFKKNAPVSLRRLQFSLGGVLEFRNVTPLSDAVDFLELVAGLASTTNTGYFLASPMNANRRDAGLHIHFSIEKSQRRESLEPILRAWNHLILFKFLAEDVTNVFESRHTSFTSEIATRGMVRLIDSHHIELREHFADPETEMAMFMELASMSNAEAVNKVYHEWLPKISPNMIRSLLIQSPKEFKIIFSDPNITAIAKQSLGEVKIQDWILKFITEMLQDIAKPGHDSNLNKKTWDMVELLSRDGRAELDKLIQQHFASPEIRTAFQKGSSEKLAAARDLMSFTTETNTALRTQIAKTALSDFQTYLNDALATRHSDPTSIDTTYFRFFDEAAKQSAGNFLVQLLKSPNIVQAVSQGDARVLDVAVDVFSELSSQQKAQIGEVAAKLIPNLYKSPLPTGSAESRDQAQQRYWKVKKLLILLTPATFELTAKIIMKEHHGIYAMNDTFKLILDNLNDQRAIQNWIEASTSSQSGDSSRYRVDQYNLMYNAQIALQKFGHTKLPMLHQWYAEKVEHIFHNPENSHLDYLSLVERKYINAAHYLQFLSPELRQKYAHLLMLETSDSAASSSMLDFISADAESSAQTYEYLKKQVLLRKASAGKIIIDKTSLAIRKKMALCIAATGTTQAKAAWQKGVSATISGLGSLGGKITRAPLKCVDLLSRKK